MANMRQSSLDGLTGRGNVSTPKPRPSSSETNLRKLAGSASGERPGSALGLLQGNLGCWVSFQQPIYTWYIKNQTYLHLYITTNVFDTSFISSDLTNFHFGKFVRVLSMRPASISEAVLWGCNAVLQLATQRAHTTQIYTHQSKFYCVEADLLSLLVGHKIGFYN